MIFLFAVRHLRWLAGVPFFPQLLDSLLLASVWVFHPQRVKAMELLESEMLRLPGISLRVHRFGGMEFHHAGLGELGHVHGHGLLDLKLGKEKARRWIEAGRVKPHHVLPTSGWVSLQLDSPADVPFALELLQTGLAK